VGAGSFFDYPGEEAPTATAPAPEAPVFLPDLDDAGWNTLLAYTQVSRFGEGETVIAAGARDRSLYIVADGALEIAGADEPVTLESGTIIGEMAFFDGEPHGAAVRALTDVDLLELSRDSFEVLAAREPLLARAVLMDLGRILALRLRRALADEVSRRGTGDG
jgi:CRP-like cAMP-binding protein